MHPDLSFNRPGVLNKYSLNLRWLKTVSSNFQDVDFDASYYYSLSVDATIMATKNCPIIGEHVGIVFVTL